MLSIDVPHDIFAARHEECTSQQAQELADGCQYQLFDAAIVAHDYDLA